MEIVDSYAKLRDADGLRLGVFVMGIAFLLLVPNIAIAQRIGGNVTDTTAGVLPGVTVEARSPAIIEQVRTAVTDGNGQYLIVALEPGTYTVTYSLPGFTTLVREGIVLSTGFAASIDVELSVGDIEETVTVTGDSPVVDILNVEQREVFDREVVESIPTGKSFQAYALLVPGMVVNKALGTTISQDSGGLTAQTFQYISIHGGVGGDQEQNINGLDVTDPNVQGIGIISDGNLEEMAFEYAGNSAEVETGGVRINMIPREGSNSFSGSFFATFTSQALQADNLDQELIDRGLDTGNNLEEVWLFNPSVGGPIVRDRLWFFVGHTSKRADLFLANTYETQDASSFVYVPDFNRPVVDENLIRDQALNLTAQATSRDKFKIYWNNSSTSKPNGLQGNVLGSIFISPEAAMNIQARTNLYQSTWVRPQTNRLLFEAGVSRHNIVYRLHETDEAVTTLPGILDVPKIIAIRNLSGWLSGATRRDSPKTTNTFYGAVSYVTGSHNLKVGFNGLFSANTTFNRNDNEWLDFLTLNGEPLYVNYRTPGIATNEARNYGLYAQEQWTLDRLTVNAGIRFDYINNSYPDQVALASIWAPQDFIIEEQDAVGWKDLQPRLGVAYDLFGDGRTALKVSANRYGQRDFLEWAEGLNPGLSNRSQRRYWVDLNGDEYPQCDPFNPAPNGECFTGNPNPAFGRPVITTFYDEDWGFGWGNRFSNWEFSAGAQRELIPGVSLDVAYFQRNFVNFSVQDNRAVAAGEFEQFTVNVPTDQNLPGGGGGALTLVDIRPEAFGRLPDNITTHADPFGGESRAWNGFDVTLDARLQGILLQGGVSTGTTSTDFCSAVAALPETLPTRAGRNDTVPLDYCQASTNWLTQVKLLGSYTLPFDIQVAATLQSQAGPERLAEHTYTAGELAAALGRSHTARAVTVNVLEPGTDYGERFNQVDLRFTKGFNIGNTGRVRAMLDIFNVFNANAVTNEEYALGGTYLRPFAIMPGRLAKFAFQFDF